MGQKLKQLVDRHRSIRSEIGALVSDPDAISEDRIRALDLEMTATFSSIVDMEVQSPACFRIKVDFLCDCLVEYSQDHDIVENIAEIIRSENAQFLQAAASKRVYS